MLLKVKYQLSCFFVAIAVRPRRWVQVISRHLDNMMLATTVESGSRKVLWGMCIDCHSFCLWEQIPAKSKELCKKLECIRGFSAEKWHFSYKNRLLLNEQLWWNVSHSLSINTKRKLIYEFILANPPNS